jgi:hypothetical protein
VQFFEAVQSRKEVSKHMAKNQTKPVNAKTLKADRDALAAIKKMTGYQPADPNSPYTLAKLTVLDQAASDAADAHAQAKADHKAARDGDVAAQWALHNAALGARLQVVAQFGDDSEQAAAVGLKKKSEYAKPTRTTTTATAAAKKAA